MRLSAAQTRALKFYAAERPRFETVRALARLGLLDVKPWGTSLTAAGRRVLKEEEERNG